ncbi:MAG: hypothetical protein JWN40_511 [Phycisphaerales bacterium]|nr:hypothetical protein [Phycisphaerales bacterium]
MLAIAHTFRVECRAPNGNLLTREWRERSDDLGFLFFAEVSWLLLLKLFVGSRKLGLQIRDVVFEFSPLLFVFRLNFNVNFLLN